MKLFFRPMRKAIILAAEKRPYVQKEVQFHGSNHIQV